MQTLVSGHAAVGAAAAPAPLAALRAQLTALTFGSPYLSAAEQLRANHHIHTCPDPARLQRWRARIAWELAQRETLAHGVWLKDETTDFAGLLVSPVAPALTIATLPATAVFSSKPALRA